MPFDVEKLGSVLEHINLVPPGGRRFELSADLANRQYGISSTLLDQMLTLGLPVEVREGVHYFDQYDLSNISLHGGFPSVQRMAMRTWAKTLQISDTAGPYHASVRIQGAAAGQVGSPLAELELRLTGGDMRATGAVLELLEEFARYRFFMLSEDCRWDLAFITKGGICECGGASKLLVTRAQEQGIAARHCFGLLIAEPFSTGHYWAEFLIGGAWVAFDPLLLGLLHQVTKLTPEQWPTSRSNAFALHRLSVIKVYDAQGAPQLEAFDDNPGALSPLVIMNGQILVASLPTVLRCMATSPESRVVSD